MEADGVEPDGEVADSVVADGEAPFSRQPPSKRKWKAVLGSFKSSKSLDIFSSLCLF